MMESLGINSGPNSFVSATIMYMQTLSAYIDTCMLAEVHNNVMHF